MTYNKFLLQIFPNEKMSPERKMVLMTQLSTICIDVNFLEVKNHTFYYVKVDFGIDVLHSFIKNLIENDEIYFITEVKGNVGTNIDREVFIQFMSQIDSTESETQTNNLQPPGLVFSFTPTSFITQFPFLNNIKKNIEDCDDFDDFDDDEFGTLRTTPSIDNILDKIIEFGIDSLTSEDKEILKNYK